MCVLACQESRETKGISFEEISSGSVVVPGSPDPGTSFGTYVLVDVW